MSARERTFRPVSSTGPTADAGVPAAAAPATSAPAPVVEHQDVQPRRRRRTGAAAAGDQLSPTARQRWRHQLRAAAGKLARSYEAAEQAEQAWAEVAAEARKAGVPASLLAAALADAGLPDQPGT